jgi:Family of unknown function (DUF5519)
VRGRAVVHAHLPMKLAEKGRYAPPPQLKPAAQQASEALANWAGVHARSHWLLGDEHEIDGADFYYEQEELGHIHLDSQAHVMHARSIVQALIKAGLGRRFQWSAEVVAFDIREQSDVAHALWLFELSYDRRRGTTAAELLARITQYVENSARPPAERSS